MYGKTERSEQKKLAWSLKMSRVVHNLNDLLNEAAEDGVFPAVRIHRNDKLFGFGVQVVEVSCVLGITESGLAEV